jgi:TolA-binding protein
MASEVPAPAKGANEPAPEVVPAEPPVAAKPPVVAEPPLGAEPPGAPSRPSELERRFEAGLALLRAGKSAEAARELLAAADAGGDDPLAADARYFAAVALTRAGRKTEAERALVAFLDHAPHSIRRGRAAVMLGRLIAERGDHASARAWFESALGDADASVVAAAKAGLAALR